MCFQSLASLLVYWMNRTRTRKARFLLQRHQHPTTQCSSLGSKLSFPHGFPMSDVPDSELVPMISTQLSDQIIFIFILFEIGSPHNRALSLNWELHAINVMPPYHYSPAHLLQCKGQVLHWCLELCETQHSIFLECRPIVHTYVQHILSWKNSFGLVK